MQKAIVLQYDRDNNLSLELLNEYLTSGWEVVNTCPMPSADGGYIGNAKLPTCLVIISGLE